MHALGTCAKLGEDDRLSWFWRHSCGQTNIETDRLIVILLRTPLGVEATGAKGARIDLQRDRWTPLTTFAIEQRPEPPAGDRAAVQLLIKVLNSFYPSEW